MMPTTAATPEDLNELRDTLALADEGIIDGLSAIISPFSDRLTAIEEKVAGLSSLPPSSPPPPPPVVSPPPVSPPPTASPFAIPPGYTVVGGLHPERGQTLAELEQLYTLFGHNGMKIDDFGGSIGKAMEFWFKPGNNSFDGKRVEVKFTGQGLSLPLGKMAIPSVDSLGPDGDVVAPQWHTTGSNGRSPALLALHQYGNDQKFTIGHKEPARDWMTDGSLLVPAGRWIGIRQHVKPSVNSDGFQNIASYETNGTMIDSFARTGRTILVASDAPLTLQFGVYVFSRPQAKIYIRNLDLAITTL
jgi:hypothetical protein